MELFAYSADLARIVFIIGAVLAVVYKKYTGVTPGGVVVPAFLALLLDQSFIWFCIIFGASLLTRLLYLISFQAMALPRRWVVFINIAMSTAIVLAAQYLFGMAMPSTEAAAFGYVIPGLLSANIMRYRLQPVVLSTLGVTAVTYSIGYLCTQLVPFGWATSLTSQLGMFTPLQLGSPLILLPTALVVTGLTMWAFGTRTGGYLLAPFVALLASGSVVQFAAFIVGILCCYGLLQVILRYSLIFGLERFLMSLP